MLMNGLLDSVFIFRGLAITLNSSFDSIPMPGRREKEAGLPEVDGAGYSLCRLHRGLSSGKTRGLSAQESGLLCNPALLAVYKG